MSQPQNIKPITVGDRQIGQFNTLGTARDFVRQVTVASFIAGGFAGAISRTLVSPLERMKIIFQIQSTSQPYSGIFATLAKIWREEGMRGYFRGNGTNCIRIVPYSATQFAAYSVYKRLLLPRGASDLDTPRRLCAGAMAGISSVTFTYPLDLVRTRLSVETSGVFNATHTGQARSTSGIWRTIKNIYMVEGGVRALYRGILPTVMGVAPYVGINFAVYEKMREIVTDRGQKNPSALGKLFSGAVSGAVAQTITYPMDVLRRRFQVSNMKAITDDRYSSIADAVRQILAKEGIRGFYKGLLPNLLKVAPSMATSWLTFEYVKDLCLAL